MPSPKPPRRSSAPSPASSSAALSARSAPSSAAVPPVCPAMSSSRSSPSRMTELTVSFLTSCRCCCRAVSSPMTCSPKWLSWSWRSDSIAAGSPCSLRSSRRCLSFISLILLCHCSCSMRRCCDMTLCSSRRARAWSKACISRSFIWRFSSFSLLSWFLAATNFSYSAGRPESENLVISSFAFLACSRRALISRILSCCSGVMPFPDAHSCAVWTMDRVCSRSRTRWRNALFDFFMSWNFCRTKSSGRGLCAVLSSVCAMRMSTGSGGSSSMLSFTSSSRPSVSMAPKGGARCRLGRTRSSLRGWSA
mmetsp:Transcript_7105/g.16088  ORF Transcript_7105/g.16088 Transcript_7105/m.16088 type:complete len:307 (-) Transcript_7105:8-928(-)